MIVKIRVKFIMLRICMRIRLVYFIGVTDVIKFLRLLRILRLFYLVVYLTDHQFTKIGSFYLGSDEISTI